MSTHKAIDPNYLQYQYGTAEKLRIRQEAHRLYSETPTDYGAWLFGHLDAQPGEIVLDVGCGPGTFYPVLRTFGVKIVALDASLGMVSEIEAQNVATQWPAQANAERLPIAAASCHRVMANHMLYHVPDQVAALTEMRRVLRPGGRVLISTNSQNNHIELLDLHRSAAAQLGFAASPSTEHRFNTGHLELVRSVFPTAVLYEQHAAFAFPTTASALAYYASGIIDLVDPRSADDSHQPQFLAILGGQIDAIIAEKGIFRVYKGVGVFVADIEP
ncbi:MAG: class I SAM-dependent methyltransferase [Caldilineaceae bacterium]|nr:class I SAM-dependent methyltransferase [Caldilineaceae bacterium]MBP8107633.1 class I SAM-dependent methyltransferase [Caldilineaceae bacterium]MBP8123258.1 class I SAM-dependent methyltransferase [Caldilineaceae bacterium]MBP9072743.1 class I SAM-dependent methyltransferase [Caldilineaceae bacterium]